MPNTKQGIFVAFCVWCGSSKTCCTGLGNCPMGRSDTTYITLLCLWIKNILKLPIQKWLII